jgi:hypothetical protein
MLKHALKLKMQYVIVTSLIWEHLFFDDSISCILKYSQFDTNFPSHNLILEMVQICYFMGLCFLHIDIMCLKHV